MADKKDTSHTAEPKSDVMKMANAAREKANLMNDDQRSAALLRGMQLIYGGSNRVTAQTGRP
jgi:hypothetical protein